MWKPILGSLVLILLWPGMAGAQTLTGNQTAEVVSGAWEYWLYDTSTLYVKQGGYVEHGAVYGNATLSISDGGSVGMFGVYDSGHVEVDQAFIGGDPSAPGYLSGGLLLYNNSTATLTGATGGGLLLGDDSHVTASGSTFGYIECDGRSRVVLSDVTFYEVGSPSICLFDSSVATLYNVNTSSSLGIGYHAAMEIHGGSIAEVVARGTAGLFSGDISALSAPGGRVNFYGSDFLASDGLSFSGDQVIGTGTLSGKWLDGSTFSTTITQNTGTIYAVPEPATMSLLVVGGLALLRRKGGYAG